MCSAPLPSVPPVAGQPAEQSPASEAQPRDRPPMLDYKPASYMHSIKTSLWSVEPVVNPSDAQWDITLGRFHKLSHVYRQAQRHMTTYLGHMHGLLVTSDAVANAFITGLDEASTEATTSGIDDSARYTQMMSQIRDRHSVTNRERADRLAEELERRDCLRPIIDELLQHKSMRERIAQRDAYRKEYAYYTNKVNRLRSEPNAATSARLVRNQAKLDTATAGYHQYEQRLIHELQQAWDNRLKVLGPTMADFLRLETEVSHLFQAGIDQAAADIATAEKAQPMALGRKFEADRVLSGDKDEMGVAASGEPSERLGIGTDLPMSPSSLSSSTSDGAPADVFGVKSAEPVESVPPSASMPSAGFQERQ